MARSAAAGVVAPLGPDALPPPVLPRMPTGAPNPDGRYVRADRPVRAHSGALRPAYTWQAG